MVKTVKLQLFYADDETLEFHKAQEELWELQKEVRSASNRMIQMCWEYNGFESDWKKQTGKYPTKDEGKEVLGGKTLAGIIYNRAKEDAPNLNTSDLSTTSQLVIAKFNSMKANIMRGTASIPSFKRNLPIDLHKKAIKLTYEEDVNGAVVNWFFELSLFSLKRKKELGISKSSLKFKAVVPARSKKFVSPILERCYDGEYEICSSKLNYDNGKWYLLMCFSFERKEENMPVLDKSNIMGVHIGEHNAVQCVFSDKSYPKTIDGGEIEAFAIQIEKRRRSIGTASKKHSDLCGDGRTGHGYHAKMSPLKKIGAKVANFRNTVNHRYSRQIVDWAVQHKCGTIQLEDLTGYATNELERYKLLKNWSYFDLMTKIESKAKEYGIEVVKVGYRSLQKWCNQCQNPSVIRKKDGNGNVHLVCTECGQVFEINDNISKALAVQDIAEILKKSKDQEDIEETSEETTENS